MSLDTLANYASKIESLAQQLGLDYYPVDFEVVPANFMTEIAVYGLPVRMPHWSFGIRYIHQLIRQSMGHSRIFEVMFPGDPCHAYLVRDNSIAENILVVAHVIGHADFAKHNQLFARFMTMAGGQILEQAASRARAIERALIEHGQEKVEQVLDAAFALEPHIDTHQPLHRAAYADPGSAALQSAVSQTASSRLAVSRLAASLPPGSSPVTISPLKLATDEFSQRFQSLPGERPIRTIQEPITAETPTSPEYDLLWFIAQYAPALQGWERDIFLAVREESFYFYPVFACQIMNEGWASYWHARLLREADFLPPELYLAAIKAHSDVVRPFAADLQLALSINPYHLGFSIWEDIIERYGLDRARQICRDEDDFGFIRNYLTQQLADKLDLFVYEADHEGGIRISDKNIHAIREAILAPKFNYGAPRVAIKHLHADGSLVLVHDVGEDARGLDLPRAERVVDYIARVWQRPVSLQTVGINGQPKILAGHL
jgi:stage V sporulation protein R